MSIISKFILPVTSNLLLIVAKTRTTESTNPSIVLPPYYPSSGVTSQPPPDIGYRKIAGAAAGAMLDAARAKAASVVFWTYHVYCMYCIYMY